MKNRLKYGLLGVIALALIVNGYLLWNNSNGISKKEKIIQKRAESKKSKPTKSLDASKTSVNDRVKLQDKSNTPLINSSKALTSMVFEESSHDFGKINQETKNVHIFKFTNTGTEPLIISKAKGSCGCTVPEYPKYPIEPGKTDEIKVIFNSGKKKGKQNKTVTLSTNTQPPNTIITIIADVMLPSE